MRNAQKNVILNNDDSSDFSLENSENDSRFSDDENQLPQNINDADKPSISATICDSQSPTSYNISTNNPTASHTMVPSLNVSCPL